MFNQGMFDQHLYSDDPRLNITSSINVYKHLTFCVDNNIKFSSFIMAKVLHAVNK